MPSARPRTSRCGSSGAADAQAAAKFQAAIEKNLPGILTVSIGLAKHVGEVAGNMEVVIQGVQAGITGAGDPLTIGRLTACVGAPFKGALDAVASVKANVNVSVNVQASASASAPRGLTSGAPRRGRAGKGGRKVALSLFVTAPSVEARLRREHRADAAGLGDLARELRLARGGRRCARRARPRRSRRTTLRAWGSSLR